MDGVLRVHIIISFLIFSSLLRVPIISASVPIEENPLGTRVEEGSLFLDNEATLLEKEQNLNVDLDIGYKVNASVKNRAIRTNISDSINVASNVTTITVPVSQRSVSENHNHGKFDRANNTVKNESSKTLILETKIKLDNTSLVSISNSKEINDSLNKEADKQSKKDDDTFIVTQSEHFSAKNKNFDARADISPHELTASSENTSIKTSVNSENSFPNHTYSVGSSTSVRNIRYPAMSWLDVFMLQHRDSVWVIVNTAFMAIWIIMGALSLYRLFGLPFCSPYISRTKYLVIHLLIFTAATFEFVQLIHLSYGSHEGLPLFLTLLLTHTPTPCLIAALILLIYCVLVAGRVPIFGNYLPPIIYVSILISFILVLSFVGDIIVGVTRSSIVLILTRVSLLILYLFCAFTFLFNYRKIVGVALLMRREYRGDLKALAIPVDSVRENSDSKLHLKQILLIWTRVTLISCLFGILMFVFSFCLTLFFTIPYVPLWAFWVLHSSIFISQIAVVLTITFGAAFTLIYTNQTNVFRRYFCPSFPSVNSSNGSFIKRGNFIYQRVSVTNGPVIAPPSYPPTIVEAEESTFYPNNTIVTKLSAPPRSKVNLKRSATFNCAPPYGFHRSSTGAPFTPNLYPVLSDHILPCTQSNIYANFQRPSINNTSFTRGYGKPTIQHSHSFHRYPPNRENDVVKYGHTNPFQRFQDQDKFLAFDNISKGNQQKELSPTSPGMAGTVETLEVAYQPINILPPRIIEDDIIRQIPHNHSFNAADRARARTSKAAPEKPARKTEPILVKSIIKDNACLENIVPFTETTIQGYKRAYSPKNTNSYLANSSYQPIISKSTIPNASLSPNVNTFSDINSSTPLMISKYSFNSGTPSVSPISSQYQVETCLSKKSSSDISSVTDLSSQKLNGTQNSERNNFQMQEVKVSGENSENHSFISKQKANDIDNLSLMSDEPPIIIDSKEPSKKHSLRRNHSTAGDFPQLQKENENEDKTSEEANGFKHPWYGTWGGRRKSKKRHSTMGQEHSTSTSTLRRLSASKSSLSSIYEKLKPKKGKGACKKPHPDDFENGFEHSSAEANDNLKDDLTNSSMSHEEEEEEEEELLPRLDEDIDLTSEILKSSTVLADFYSLDRSYLKKRKKERIEERKEEEEEEEKENGAFELNGMKKDSESNSSKNSIITLHAEEKT